MMDEITTNKDKRMQLRKLPSAPIHYFNPEEKCFLLLGISESTKYLLLYQISCTGLMMFVEMMQIMVHCRFTTF